MQHIVSVGGGLSSTMELPERVIQRYGRGDNVHFIMARLPNEDPDVWRLTAAVEDWLAIKITYIGHNMTPWDVFFKERMMGSSRIDPCSRILKREALDRWVRDLSLAVGDADVTLNVGITYGEAHRLVAITAGFKRRGWQTSAPLAHDPTVTRDYLMEKCRRLFGFVPRLYEYGFNHNNCSGACVKAGHKEWARLLRFLPDVYDWWEQNEARFQREIGTEATILRDRRGGVTKNYSLRQFREEMQAKWQDMLPGMDPFEGLEESPACAFCTAA